MASSAKGFQEWFSEIGQYLDMDTGIEPEVKGFARAAWHARDADLTRLARAQAETDVNHYKDAAYHERDMLVCALSKLFPASLERHPDEDKTWEHDWRWIVFIDLPTGQATWHIHDSELEAFAHLPRFTGRKWDGHTTPEKYARVALLTPSDKDALAEALIKAEERGRQSVAHELILYKSLVLNTKKQALEDAICCCGEDDVLSDNVTIYNKIIALVTEANKDALVEHATDKQPFFFAIETAVGDWHDGEMCVFGDLRSAQDEVDNLNEELPEDQWFRVVSLYRRVEIAEHDRRVRLEGREDVYNELSNELETTVRKELERLDARAELRAGKEPQR